MARPCTSQRAACTCLRTRVRKRVQRRSRAPTPPASLPFPPSFLHALWCAAWLPVLWCSLASTSYPAAYCRSNKNWELLKNNMLKAHLQCQHRFAQQDALLAMVHNVRVNNVTSGLLEQIEALKRPLPLKFPFPVRLTALPWRVAEYVNDSLRALKGHSVPLLPASPLYRCNSLVLCCSSHSLPTANCRHARHLAQFDPTSHPFRRRRRSSVADKDLYQNSREFCQGRA